MVASSVCDGHRLLVSKVADDIVHRVGRRIGELRRQRGLTQSELGERLGIAQKNVHRLESGTQNLTLRTIVKVAQALDVDVEALLQAALPPRSFLRESHTALAISSQLAPRPVPVFRIVAAAGFARDGQLADVIGWALVDQPVDERYFVASVEGDSMTPTIADGAWCLFRRCTQTPANGAVVLVERERDDGGGRYVVKRLQRWLRADDGAVVVTLASDNADHPTLNWRGTSEDDVNVLAEFVEVVDAPAAGTSSGRKSAPTRKPRGSTTSSGGRRTAAGPRRAGLTQPKKPRSPD
jgi:HTH-type transcriptional regulator/antitoxin HipB